MFLKSLGREQYIYYLLDLRLVHNFSNKDADAYDAEKDNHIL